MSVQGKAVSSFSLSVSDIVYVTLISGRCELSEIEFLAMRDREITVCIPFL